MVKLETLLTSIATSVQTSQAAIQQNAYENFMQYFVSPTEKDGSHSDNAESIQTLFPILSHFRVPDSAEGGDIAIPAVALVNHDSLVLENIKVVLNVSGVSNGKNFMVNTKPMNDTQELEHHQITLEFKHKEPTEGMSRILTAYNQFL